MATARVRGVAELIFAARQEFLLNQRDFGHRVGSSQRTMQRWESGQTSPTIIEIRDIAQFTYPRNRQIALELARCGGTNLVQLGLEPSSAPPKPEAMSLAVGPAGPTTWRGAAVPPRPSPTLAHLARAAICSAAEANSMTPQSVRPILLAALQSMSELGLTADEMLQGMAPPAPAKSSAKKATP